MHIASVEKLPLSTTGSPLLIRCKTFLSVTFVIAKERDSHDVYSTLIKLCQPRKCILNAAACSLFNHARFYSELSEPVLLPVHIKQRGVGEISGMGFFQIGKRIPPHEAPKQWMAFNNNEQGLRVLWHISKPTFCSHCCQHDSSRGKLKISIQRSITSADLFTSQQGVNLPLFATTKWIQCALHGRRANASRNKKNKPEL